ncbi:MAG TPA: OS_HP3 family (seleno)protein, partial [Syntrophobacteraceae bacterium]|nr:OS_HP3 family (seleno)protein [Syntrophobacteraceae bacterium]
LTYDENLMTVSISQETAENPNGYVLDIEPKLDGVPIGSRKQATLTIETDLSADEKAEVLVNILNHSDQPEARQK